MADLEFFFDPVCPWAWITSRWVEEVRAQRHYDVSWRFISLAVLNEGLVADWYTPSYRAGHLAGLSLLRVADAVRVEVGDDAIGPAYTAFGRAIHVERLRNDVRDEPVKTAAMLLEKAGLPTELAEHALDDSHDKHIRAETATALERTGEDVGTPILTFHPGQADEGSFFGPVISQIPRGEAAAKLWDAVEVLATTSGMAELKRSNRLEPVYT